MKKYKFIEDFKKLPRRTRILIIFCVVLIFSILSHISGLSKPSLCDCKEVMIYGDNAVEAAKKILGNSYGAEFMRRSQNECALKYWDEIKGWQESRLLVGTPADNAIEFFLEKCY